MPGQQLTPPQLQVFALAAALPTAALPAAAQGADAATSLTSLIQLTPFGSFRAYDGRPGSLECGYDDWQVNANSLAAMQTGERGNDVVVDFAHKTIFGAGVDAPAAGWIKRSALAIIDDTTGDNPSASGLWATVDWTPRGRQAVLDGDYKYISPVFTCDKQGNVTGLHSVALTNDPALSNMAAVALSAQVPFPSTQFKKETPMLLAALVAALGLAQDTTDAAALSSIAALKADNTRLAGAAFDPIKHIPMEQYTALQAQHAALSAQVDAAGKTAALTAALADGRILPAQRDYWAAQPLAALTEYLKVAQPIAALSGQQSTSTAGADDKPQALSAAELHVCTVTNISPEAFAKRKATMQATAALQGLAA